MRNYLLIAIRDEALLVYRAPATFRVRDMSYRDNHDSGRYKHEFGSNSSLFIPFKLSSSTASERTASFLNVIHLYSFVTVLLRRLLVLS